MVMRIKMFEVLRKKNLIVDRRPSQLELAQTGEDSENYRDECEKEEEDETSEEKNIERKYQTKSNEFIMEIIEESRVMNIIFIELLY